MVKHYANGYTEFYFLRPHVRRVLLIGDFTDWLRWALPMRRLSNAWWTCRLRLDPGVYQFQYLADGQRYLDFAAFGLERGPMGGWNSVVFVGELAKVETPWGHAASPHVGTTSGREV